MLNLVPHPAAHADSLWLLVPPPLPPLTLRSTSPAPSEPTEPSEESLLLLELWASLTGAPSAIPPEVWDMPLADLDFEGVCAVVKQIMTALSTRIPFLWEEPLEYADCLDDLRTYFTIPVYPQAVDLCGGDYIYGGPVLMWVAALCGYEVEALPYPLPATRPQGLNVLDMDMVDFAVPDGHPLTGLRDIIRMLLHTTDTFFLDACPSCWQSHGEDFVEWTEENITWLADHAAQTLVILERIGVLEQWVADDPTRIESVWQTLVDAYTAPTIQPPPPPKTLIEVWGLMPPEEEPLPSDDTLTGVPL